MNDQDRRKAADELGDGFTRIATTLAHVDVRRINLAGQHEGDGMTPLERIRFAFQGQPRAARYDGDSESTPAREPHCTCGHPHAVHTFAVSIEACTNDPTRYTLPSLDPPRCPANRDVRCDGCKGNLTRTVRRPESTCHRDCKCLHYEPDGVRGLNSDPTGMAAILPDKAAHDLKSLDRLLRDAERVHEAIWAVLVKYGHARPAGDAERSLVARENIKPEPGCANCGKHGHWQPIDPRRPNLAICRFCAEWRIAVGADPGKRECDLHADSKTVRRPDANHVARRKGTAA